MGTTPTYALPYPELTDVANVPADMRELAEAVDGSLVTTSGDTGWKDVTILAGFAASADKPQVRRVGSVIYGRGAWAPTGMVINANHAVGTLPAGFWPVGNVIIAGGSAGSSIAIPTAVIFNSTGQVIIRTSATLPTWIYINALTYFLG